MLYNFRTRLVQALGEGILLLAKWGLIIIVILYSFSYLNQTRQAALNGEQAAIAIREFQDKGWLPKLNTDGTVPQRINNATP